MLGTEYNWLIEITRPANGVPRARMAGGAMLTLAIAVFCFVCVAVRAEPAQVTLLRAAGVAAKAGDNPLVIAKLEAARDLRPDYPRIIYNLARAYTAAGRTGDAIVQLRELTTMGLTFDFTRDERLTALRDRSDFIALTQASAANNAPAGADETAFVLSGMDGIIEGLAGDPATPNWYFSDVRNRCVWIRDGSGPAAGIKKFSADTDGLLGVFGLKIDEPRHTLWAGTAARPEMKGYTAADKGRAALVEFDLGTGRVRRSFAVPADGGDHVLGDLLLAPDGSVFVSDSIAPVIWRLAAGADHLEKWLASDDFVSLQGMAFSADGNSLVIADYANGLWHIDLATRALTLLPAPAHTTLFGIDGLYAAPGGFIAVQNGIAPQRIIRLACGPDGRPAGVRVLRAGQAAMSDVSLGQVVGDRFDFIGNSGWSLYGDPPAAPAARTVTILSTPL